VPADPHMELVVFAHDLAKRFDSFTAVAGIDFTVHAGEVLGFLGPNGAGKTTTIRMITCTSPRTSGTLTVFGMDVSLHPREIKAQTGVAPQDNNLDPDFTVLQNLITYGRYFRLPAREARKRASQLLGFVQLTEKADEAVENLSGGMKRRLILARSLLNRPRLLILDEPTTGLDPQGRRLIWERIRALRQGGITVVLTTHYMEEAEQICDRILIMDHGRIIAEGSPPELIQRHVGGEVLEVVPEDASKATFLAEIEGRCPYQRLGEKWEIFTPDGAEMLQRLKSRGKLSSYGIRRPNLEDVFLRLTGRDLRE
jgi:lipooligosaccharide transport system ATP-binding protein